MYILCYEFNDITKFVTFLSLSEIYYFICIANKCYSGFSVISIYDISTSQYLLYFEDMLDSDSPVSNFIENIGG